MKASGPGPGAFSFFGVTTTVTPGGNAIDFLCTVSYN